MWQQLKMFYPQQKMFLETKSISLPLKQHICARGFHPTILSEQMSGRPDTWGNSNSSQLVFWEKPARYLQGIKIMGQWSTLSGDVRCTRFSLTGLSISHFSLFHLNNTLLTHLDLNKRPHKIEEVRVLGLWQNPYFMFKTCHIFCYMALNIVVFVPEIRVFYKVLRT